VAEPSKRVTTDQYIEVKVRDGKAYHLRRTYEAPGPVARLTGQSDTWIEKSETLYEVIAQKAVNAQLSVASKTTNHRHDEAQVSTPSKECAFCGEKLDEHALQCSKGHSVFRLR
jgi:hypothetical protein